MNSHRHFRCHCGRLSCSRVQRVRCLGDWLWCARKFSKNSDAPAAWALVELSASVLNRTVTAQGIADSEGRLALIFPYPEPTNVSPGSPVANGPQLLSQQSWTLTFRAWHTFDPESGDFVDLDRVLSQIGRAPDHLWDDGSPLIPFTVAELVFGRELVVPVAAWRLAATKAVYHPSGFTVLTAKEKSMPEYLTARSLRRRNIVSQQIYRGRRHNDNGLYRSTRLAPLKWIPR